MSLAAMILLGILLFFVLLFVVPLRIVCTFDSARHVDFRLAIWVLFFRIGILPRKKRLPNLKRFRRDVLERLYEKKRKKAEAAAKAKEKKAERRKQKKQRAQQRAEKRTAHSGYTPRKRGVKHIIKLVLALTGVLLDRFGKYLRVNISYLDITAGSKEPASTAILYGWAWAAMENLWNLLSHTRMFRRVRKNRISIYADFCAEKPSVRGKITFSIALWQIAALLISGVAAALSVQTEARRKESAEERLARQQKEAQARAEMIRELKR